MAVVLGDCRYHRAYVLDLHIEQAKRQQHDKKRFCERVDFGRAYRVKQKNKSYRKG
jgi:hypothetical protein